MKKQLKHATVDADYYDLAEILADYYQMLGYADAHKDERYVNYLIVRIQELQELVKDLTV